jgi:hypothetical protein
VVVLLGRIIRNAGAVIAYQLAAVAG